jgi:hypothetical protein
MTLKEEATAQPHWVERRRFARQDLRMSARATIHPSPACNENKTTICHVLMRNSSEEGICLVCPRPVSEGQRIELELFDRRTLVVTCRWSTRTDEGMFRAGCRVAKSMIN